MGIWTYELDKTWLEELDHQVVVLGKKSNSGLKKEAWTAVLKTLNNAHNLDRTMVQLKSRYDTIKGMYGVVVKLANSSGMGWESSRCRVECLSTTWDDVLAGKPKSWRTWQNRPFPQFAHCETLFRGTMATGRLATASTAPPPAQVYHNEYEHEHGEVLENDAGNDSSTDEVPSNQVDAGRARHSASTEERQKKRQRTSLASKLSNDFRAVNDAAVKELELLTQVLRPSSVGIGMSPTERAIRTVQQDFADELEIDDMVLAFDIMENGTGAAMFLCMEGENRSAWLHRQLNQLTTTTIA
ncbi:hypothetical protein DYB35_006275 [Aphanomyces astaci]|uniref:Myb/SANT-like domain-containing protein n=1 Tax=Aphanomyces astaci TaxID=112090 RepID=A0A3R6XHW1_APHAT|nr:hypothetical protein DYB35_006275 [Aphanomyces astaci]